MMEPKSVAAGYRRIYVGTLVGIVSYTLGIITLFMFDLFIAGLLLVIGGAGLTVCGIQFLDHLRRAKNHSK